MPSYNSLSLSRTMTHFTQKGFTTILNLMHVFFKRHGWVLGARKVWISRHNEPKLIHLSNIKNEWFYREGFSSIFSSDIIFISIFTSTNPILWSIMPSSTGVAMGLWQFQMIIITSTQWDFKELFCYWDFFLIST